MEDVKIFKGALSVDDRGEVGFVNDFDFAGVKRFYTIVNHTKGFVRAWHGHKNESKYFHVINGSALVCAVKIDDWAQPNAASEVKRFVLTEKSPAVLFIPKGYANGSMSLTDDAKIIVFSTSTLQDSLNDDYRFHARYWDPWSIEER